MADFSIKFLLLSAVFLTASTLPLSEFFPFGGAGDFVILDKENNTRNVPQDDGVFQIKTLHIPFFNRTENTDVQVRGLCNYVLSFWSLNPLLKVGRA